MKAGLCLLFVCAAIFVPWAYAQKKHAYEKVDAKLQRRKQKIMCDNMWRQRELNLYLEDLKITELSERSDASDGINDSAEDYSYEFTPSAFVYISVDHYTDEDEDTFIIYDLEYNGYEYRDSLAQMGKSADLYTFGPPQPQNEMSRNNDKLMQAVREIDPMEEPQGVYQGYLYEAFFVQGLAYINYDLSNGDQTYVDILDLSDIEKAKKQIISENGDIEQTIVQVIIFEDQGPFLRQWSTDIIKNAAALLLLWGIVVLTLFLYEKNTEKMLRLEKEAEEAIPKEEEPAVPDVDIPYEKSVSEETARVLFANISLAEQSMGPNPYLDRLREEIQNRCGKNKEAQEHEE